MNIQQIKTMMMEIPIFDQLSADELDVVAKHVEYIRIKKGTVILKEGSLGNTLFYIIGGKIEIKKESMDGKQVVLSQFAKGSIVGELALLEGESRRSATADAVEDCDILSLSRPKFDAMVKENPNIGIVILREIGCILAKRLRSTSGRFADLFG